MIRNAAIIGLSATLLAACVPVPAKGPNPPAPEPQAESTTPTPAEPMEGLPLAPVDVRRLTCATLTGATDDDKAYATSFLLGYRSALIHSRTIEIKRIEAVEEAALKDCAGKPDALATKVFAAALAKIGPGGEVRELPRVHHREPGQAAPGLMAPAQQAPAPGESTAPIQYTPKPAPPPQEAPAQLTPPPPPVQTPPPAQTTAPEPAPAQMTPPPAPTSPPSPAPAPTPPAQTTTPPQATTAPAPSTPPPPASTQAAPGSGEQK